MFLIFTLFSWMAILFIAPVWPSAIGPGDTEAGRKPNLPTPIIAETLTPFVHSETLPDRITIPEISDSTLLKATYTLDSGLQDEVRRLLAKYNPDYGVVVAIEPDSGRILAMTDSTRTGENHQNLSLVNSFPAASISKIITAIAAVNENKLAGSTLVSYNGKSTSLYKKNVFRHKNNKWTRTISFDRAFANSVNTIFGRVGAVTVGGDTMLDYAYRLGFNGQFDSDFTFDNGHIELDPDDQWQVAEMASGYTDRNTLSVLHGAVIAATAVNNGNLVMPVIVDSLTDPHGIPVYVHEKPVFSPVMSEAAAAQLKKMMQSTVRVGSARRSFRKLNRSVLKDVAIGGKTGSLTGYKPKGKYDWFVGFGERGDHKIAFAVLCINKEKWYVKSSLLARQIMEYYFSPDNGS